MVLVLGLVHELSLKTVLKFLALASVSETSARTPRVIKFAYKSFETIKGKCFAVCSSCSRKMSDKVGSGITLPCCSIKYKHDILTRTNIL